MQCITFACNYANMKLKIIRLYLKNALLVVLAAIVLAGATGLSYQAHYCHDKLAGIAFYPELGLQQSASCGCANDLTDKNSPPANSKPVLTKNSCCSNVSYFSKLSLESSVKDLSSLVLLQPAVISVLSNVFASCTPEKVESELPVSSAFPSPLAGRKLVLFLSQQRIPLISYNC